MPAVKKTRKTGMARPSRLESYVSLRSAVRAAIRSGKERAQAAVEREKVRTAWEVGHLILEHILLNKDRAQYGARVIEKLSGDIGISKSEINRMVEFAEAYPIGAHARQLTWSDYRELLSVNDAEKREVLAERAVRGSWTRKRLRAEIRKIKGGSGTSGAGSAFKAIKPGTLDVFRTRVVGGESLLDLGFSTYLEKRGMRKKLKIVKDRRFTYRGRVESVVDGDTLWCVVDLGLGVKTRQKLRLRGLNAPEVISAEGEQAKRFLTRKLPKASAIVLQTAKADKFDRYLADVWAGDIYLNKLLVDEGYAVGV